MVEKWVLIGTSSINNNGTLNPLPGANIPAFQFSIIPFNQVPEFVDLEMIADLVAA